MKFLFFLPLIVLCSCVATPTDVALSNKFVSVCNWCNATNTLKPIASRTHAVATHEGAGVLCAKTLTFSCVCCKKPFTQESEPIFEPIRPKALLAH